MENANEIVEEDKIRVVVFAQGETWDFRLDKAYQNGINELKKKEQTTVRDIFGDSIKDYLKKKGVTLENC